MAIALLTTYLTAYRMPLFERLADRHQLEVLCFGGGARYVPEWFSISTSSSPPRHFRRAVGRRARGVRGGA